MCSDFHFGSFSSKFFWLKEGNNEEKTLKPAVAEAVNVLNSTDLDGMKYT